jgi:hypothetical protein
MARTERVSYKGVQGRVRRNWNWNAINERSTVIITAAQWVTESAAGGVIPASHGRYRLGEADVYVTNIGPHGDASEAGGVEFYLHANTDEPIDVVAAITVLEEYERFESP